MVDVSSEFLLQDFLDNFKDDPTVKIPWVRRDLCCPRVLVMEWINGRRCTDPGGIRASGLDVNAFIRGGVVSALRQLLEVLTGLEFCFLLLYLGLLLRWRPGRQCLCPSATACFPPCASRWR